MSNEVGLIASRSLGSSLKESGDSVVKTSEITSSVFAIRGERVGFVIEERAAAAFLRVTMVELED